MIAATASVHPTAVVEDGAQIGENTTIGPFCYVGPNATIDEECLLMSHVVVTGRTKVGARARVFHGAVLGCEPQNVKYKGEDTELIVGTDCVIREGVTMHTGMVDAGGKTIVGDHCLFLAYAHVAHDCRVGDHVIMSNNVMLGGHVTIEDRVIIGGGAGIHQFCRVGRNAFIGGLASSFHDVIPFGMLTGNPGKLGGLNVIGMSRSGMDKPQIHTIRRLYKHIFHGPGTVRDNLAEIRGEYEADSGAKILVDFLDAESNRGLATPAMDKRA